MVFGDGSIIRAGLGALVDFLGRYAAPTGARGSILLMSGGLVVLGFLFVALLFRSAVVGDLAPVANDRRRVPRVQLPPASPLVTSTAIAIPADPFAGGRVAGAKAELAGFDDAFDHLRSLGVDVRIILSSKNHKRLRVYACASCARGASAGCEYERGLIVGAFEVVTSELAKAEEVACHQRGAPYCEFDVSHAAVEEGA